MPNGNTIKERLARLETKIEHLITNHLPHLEKKVDKLIWIIIGGLITVLVTILFK